MLILSDNLTSWFSKEIKEHTNGNYNHVMWLWWPGTVASQGWRFREENLSIYLEGKHRVKFWYNPKWPPVLREYLSAKLWADVLAAGKFDWWGVFGQLAASICKIPGLTGINFPGRNYCSEEAGSVLNRAELSFKMKHPSPADLDRWCKAAPQMEVYGIFDPIL